MRSNLASDYQMHAYGTKNVRLCEQISLLLSRWMYVTSIETGVASHDLTKIKKGKDDCFMIVFFRRSEYFPEAYSRAKKKAKWII